MPMQTDELLKILTKEGTSPDAGTRTAAWTPARALLFWGLGSLLVLALSIWLLPVREDLRERLRHVDFFFLNLLFASLTFTATRLAILSTFPEEKILGRVEVYALVLLFGAFLGWMFFRVPTENLGFEWYRERNPVNGGCGMVVLVSGMLQSALSLGFFRRGASTKPRTTGALIAFSTGAFSLLLIQFACANENPIHVFAWHLLPLMALTYGISQIAPRVLRW